MAGAPASLPQELKGVAALAVIAHPDDESFGLGAVLAAMAAAGSTVKVLCFTHGEASTLGAPEDLAAVRAAELARAAERLGLERAIITTFPDGGLAAVPEAVLDEVVEAEVGAATVVVTFEPGGVTGHPDHQAASAAGLRSASRHGLLLAEWGLAPAVAAGLREEFGVPFTALDGDGVVEFSVDRSIQRAAIDCHASQATDNPVLKRRLELQQDRERLRLSRRAGPGRGEEPTG